MNIVDDERGDVAWECKTYKIADTYFTSSNAFGIAVYIENCEWRTPLQ